MHQYLDHVRDLVQENQCQDRNQDQIQDQCLDHVKDHNLQLQGKVDQDLILGRLNLDLVPAQKHLFLDRILDHDRNRDPHQSQNPAQGPFQVHHQDHIQDRVHHHVHDRDQYQLPDLDTRPDLNQDQDLVQHQSLKDQEVEVKIQKVLLEKEIKFCPTLRKKRTVLKRQKN